MNHVRWGAEAVSRLDGHPNGAFFRHQAHDDVLRPLCLPNVDQRLLHNAQHLAYVRGVTLAGSSMPLKLAAILCPAGTDR